MTLEDLIQRARELRGDADRLTADVRRDSEYDPEGIAWKAEQLANAIDRGIRLAEGRSSADEQ